MEDKEKVFGVFHPYIGSMEICKPECRACNPERNIHWLNVCKALLYKMFEQNKVVGIDLGAHVGIYGIGLKDQVRTMFSFEADEKIYQSLVRNSLKYPNIVPSLSTAWGFTKDEKVALDDLSPLIDGKRIGYIKIDIEGAEVHALRGMKNILDKCEVTLLDIEFCKCHFPYFDTTTEEYFEIIEKAGFKQIDVVKGEMKPDLLANAGYQHVTNLFYAKGPEVTW